MNVLQLFVFALLGLSVGSFVNVIALRYDSDKFLLNFRNLRGRSHCPKCQSTLRWYELIPVVSFVIQLARCRTCGGKISPQYPIAEIVSGLIFVFVPLHFFANPSLFNNQYSILQSTFSILWILAFTTLLLITLVDLRLHLIPDEANIFLGILGVVSVAAHPIPYTLNAIPSFLGPYALIFGLQGNLWLNHIAAALLGLVFFLSLVLLTRGRGMGMGDVKLAGALGFLFGWPDIALITMLAFIAGGAVGGMLMLLRKKTMKSAIPFGPYLALGAALTFLWGEGILRWYFGLFS